MPKYRSKKYGTVYERCDICKSYSCYSDGKNYYCGNCIEVYFDKKGVIKFRRKNDKR